MSDTQAPDATVEALLAELAESPLPGARYAYEVVKRRLATPEAAPEEGLITETTRDMRQWRKRIDSATPTPSTEEPASPVDGGTGHPNTSDETPEDNR